MFGQINYDNVLTELVIVTSIFVEDLLNKAHFVVAAARLVVPRINWQIALVFARMRHLLHYYPRVPSRAGRTAATAQAVGSTWGRAMIRVVILLITLLTGQFVSASCELPLDKLLANYVEARGGHGAIEAQRALRIVSIHHEGKWNPAFDYRIMKPGYMWIAAIYDDGVIIREGFDGERGWEKWGDKPAEYVGGDANKGVNQGAVSPVHLYGLHHMKGLGAEVELRGCERIDGVEYYVLNVISAFGTDIDYYINADSFLLERSRTTRPLHPTQDPTPHPD